MKNMNLHVLLYFSCKKKKKILEEVILRIMLSELSEDGAEQMPAVHVCQTCKRISFSHCDRCYSLSYVVHGFMQQSFSGGGTGVASVRRGQGLSHAAWFQPAPMDPPQGTAESLSQDSASSGKTSLRKSRTCHAGREGENKRNDEKQQGKHQGQKRRRRRCPVAPAQRLPCSPWEDRQRNG